MTDDLFELQLQEELRQMFEVDTQTYLENYITKVLQLNPPNWKTDIQEIYRAIHTIKGGAVTVGADAILYVAIALEDLLADLRYLEVAPPLEDGQLGQYLTEAGELLTSTLSISATGEAAKEAVFPTLSRIEQLRSLIQKQYLPEWNSQTIIHQEFAQQGFDLVVLELEMGVENLQPGQPIPANLFETAELTLNQLREIGRNIKLATGWSQLLADCKVLLSNEDSGTWISQWPAYFKKLKACAINSGKIVAVEPTEEVNPVQDELTDASLDFVTDISLEEEALKEEILPVESEMNFEVPGSFDLQGLTEAIETLMPSSLLDLDIETLPVTSLPPPEIEPDLTVNLGDISLVSETLDGLGSLVESLEQLKQEESLLGVDLENIHSIIEAIEEKETVSLLPEQEELDFGVDEIKEALPTLPLTPVEAISAPVEVVHKEQKQPETEANIQIPVSLSRANQTSQHLVEVLLSARMASGLYHSLSGQLMKLFSIARESVNYITRLRQIQDDYALMNDLSNSRDSSGIALERYRQGYTTINRLLEISLRLSELGAEASKITTTTNESFQSLERNILNLEQSIEATRVIPFKTLAFKARAIVRDLTNRYGKPAQLVVKGEDIELDAAIVSLLEPALLHLIRNAYDHGLEDTPERVQKGKPEKGTITLTLQRRGNQYLLSICDDGSGIDPHKVSFKAKAAGLPLTNTDTSAGLLAVLSQPGFSSKETVSELSGRGVGMDVVATQVNSLNGKMMLETQLGLGSQFKIQFPTPRLLVPCVLLHRSDRTFAIPVECVIRSSLWSSLSVEPTDPSLPYSMNVSNGSFTVPGVDLLEYWLGRSSQYPISETAIGICVGAGSDREGIWLLADDLGEQVDFLINPLPSPLVSPLGLLGVSLQINGALIPVIDGATLAESLHSTDAKYNLSKAGAATITELETETTQMILVVDDAALMRRRIEATLTAYGHPVQTCADGLEAWNWLQYNPTPALMITDLEMPNMDGFTLIQRLRNDGVTMPILVISSRLSEEWNREAQRLGADGFLTKGFSTNELINKVNSLTSHS
ncbi:response regulator [Gloeothece verrucosa]|uniref:histidine kinase n=1 Tax=Gloeothece verrucosa (strain PCC 7822) TaxID=497965 RepID=E0UBR5_GLOV7|nr:response regulator [Gloeothece verrucosa]ADN14009.1 CheA signal transduction histidine kinase [Gloeothece verrucosa PCC 7822]